MSYDRKKAKEDLQKQTKTNYSKKDSGGFTSLLIDGLPQWKCNAGQHKLDVIPYIVGNSHPTLKKGQLAYVFILWAHYGVGANNDSFICMSKMYGEDCPVCERRAQLQQEGGAEEDVLNQLKPKQYTLYNVVCHDSTAETSKGIQVWNVSHFFMEKKLLAISKDESGEVFAYADPDDGKRITFERIGSGGKNTSYEGHKLHDRKTPISDAQIEAAFKLDECIVRPTYEEVYKAVYGSKALKNKQEGNDDVHTDDNAVAESNDKDSLTEDDVRDMSRKELKALIEETKADIEIDDYDTKDELAEALIKILFDSSESKEESSDEGSDEKTCPNSKGTFGESFDQFKQCFNCPLFDDCSDEHDANYKKAKKEEKEESKSVLRKRR